jgi:hypothetical protein
MSFVGGLLLLTVQALAQSSPVIVSNSPPNGATDVAPNAPVVTIFSTAMNTGLTTIQFFNSSVPPPNSLTVTRSWNAEGTRLTNTPSPAFPAGKAITWLAIGMDLQGRPLGMPFTGAFLTSSGGALVPELVSFTPANQAVGVPTNGPVIFTFSLAMNTNLTVAQFQDVRHPDEPIATSSVWNEAHTVLTCTPVPAFPPGRVIVWTVQGEGAAGGAFPGAGGGFTIAGKDPGEDSRFSVVLSRGESAAQVAATALAASGWEFSALSSEAAFGEIAVRTPAMITNLLAGFPDGDGLEFTARTTDATAFAVSYPAGSYLFQVTTTNGAEGALMDLANGPMPGTPRFLNWQDPPRLALGRSLVLSWVLEAGGAATDYVRVQIRQGGRVLFATPLPDAPGALNAASNLIVVPSAVFSAPGSAEVSLTAFHFTGIDTNSIPGLTLHAARHRTTRFTLRVVDGSAPPPTLRFTQLPGIPVAEPILLPLRTTNGIRPIRFEQVGGSLPPGLTLAADGSLTGEAATVGSFDVTVRLTDLLGQTSTESVRLVTAPLPAFPTPRLENILHEGGAFVRFELVGGTGLDCRVERSPDLRSWTTHLGTIPPSDRIALQVPVTGDTGFFRVRGPGSPPTPNPLPVTPVLQSNVTASAKISLFGGTLNLTNAAGHVFSLEVPPGALDGTEVITLTDVSRIEGLPLSGGLRAAVDIRPGGLLFNTPARLNITGPTAVDPGTLLGFHALSDGREFALLPFVSADGTASFSLLYSSLVGLGQATLADVQAQVTRRPDDPILALSQEVAAIRMACAQGNCGALSSDVTSPAGSPTQGSSPRGAPSPNDLLIQKYIQTARQVVIPQLQTAAESDDDSALDNALLTWNRWLKEMQSLGIADDTFGQDQEGELAGCLESAAGLAARGIWNGMTRACQQCLEHDLARIGRVESLARMAGAMGWNYDTYYFDCAQNCLIFELTIESKIIQSGPKGTYSTDTKAKVELTPWEGDFSNLLFGGGYEGEGTWEVQNVQDFDTPCEVTHSPQNGEAKVPLARLKLFQKRCDYVPGQGLVLANVYFPELRVYLLANPDKMPGEGRVSRCPEDDPVDVPDIFGVSFVAIHADTAETPEVIGEPCIRLEGFEQMGSGEVLFKKVYVETQLIKDGYVEERTTVELHHKPN